MIKLAEKGKFPEIDLVDLVKHEFTKGEWERAKGDVGKVEIFKKFKVGEYVIIEPDSPDWRRPFEKHTTLKEIIQSLYAAGLPIGQYGFVEIVLPKDKCVMVYRRRVEHDKSFQ